MRSGPTEGLTRARHGAPPGEGNHSELLMYLLTRTDQSGNHLNGQGNFGFCSSDCADNNNLDQRINLVEAPEDNNDAVVFANDENAGVILPPS